jgi:nicotinamide riboside transporter PnuC
MKLVSVPEWWIYFSTAMSMVAMFIGYIVGRLHGTYDSTKKGRE